MTAPNLVLLPAAAKSLQSCPTLCDPIDGNPPGSPVPGILQARTLEWVAISFSSAWKWKVKVKSLSWVRLSATPWTAAYQAPPSMGFSRQKYWSGVPLPSPVLLPTKCHFLVSHTAHSLHETYLHQADTPVWDLGVSKWEWSPSRITVLLCKGACITQWSYEPCRAESPKTDRS